MRVSRAFTARLLGLVVPAVVAVFVACVAPPPDSPASVDAGSEGPDGGAPDAATGDADRVPDPDRVDPVDPVVGSGVTPPPLVDGGCADAAFHESFDDSFATFWATEASDGGAIALDPTYVVAPSSLRAQVNDRPSGFARASRAVCPGGGTLVCSLALRIDTVANGDVGILDLRGRADGGYAVARVKAREVLFLTPGPEGQRVARAAVPLHELARGAFHTVEIMISPSTLSLKLDGATVATLPVPASGLTLEEVRAGILYMTGDRAPGWDLRIDELRCRFE